MPKTSSAKLAEPPADISSEIQKLIDCYGAKIIKTPKNQVVRPKCAGLDVHKNILVLAVCITDSNTSEAHFTAFTYKTTNSDIVTMGDMLLELGITDICMESTGKYWIPVYNILELKGLKPVITHPKYVKQLPGKKTDYTDAIHIASMYRLDHVIASFIPPKDIRDLRELIRYRLKLIYIMTSEKNRFQNCMTISQIRIDSVLSDPFGKSATTLMKYLLETPKNDVTDDGILQCISPCVRATPDQILDSVHGFEFVDIQKFKMQRINEHLANLISLIDAIDDRLKTYRIKYQKQIDHLATMTGLTPVSALYIISEIGIDMNVWKSAESLCCWAGLTPGNHDSGGKHSSTRCSSAGHYLKPQLVQVAISATRSKREPYFAFKYQRLKKRRGYKRAIIAIARMMLISIYHMLKDEKDFHPCDYDEIMNNTEHPKVELTIRTALQFLRKQGIDQETIKQIREKCYAQKLSGGSSDQKSDAEYDIPDKTIKPKASRNKKKQSSNVQKQEKVPKDTIPIDSTIPPKILEPVTV